jgi:hypothetical protein
MSVLFKKRLIWKIYSGFDQNTPLPVLSSLSVFFHGPNWFQDNDLLPITNDDNYVAALRNARPLLRLVIQREGEFYDDHARAKSGTILGTFLGT